MGGKSQPLGKIYTDQHRADQPRRVGNGDSVDAGGVFPSFVQRLLGHADDIFGMPPGRDLRDDTAVLPVFFYLGVDNRRKNAPSVFYNGGGGFIAGRFDGKQLHSGFSSFFSTWVIRMASSAGF